MTIFEYIKQKATKEEIACMFTYLENDSGYYNESNAYALSLLGSIDVEKAKKLFFPEDKKMFDLCMNCLDKKIGE